LCPCLGIARSSKAAVHGESVVYSDVLYTYRHLALTETLALELAPFNIRVLLVAPGLFRHEGIHAVKYYTGNPIPAYDPIRNAHLKLFEGLGSAERFGGDSDKAMDRIVDVVRGEGLAKGREWPLYLILGEDAVQQLKLHCNELLDVLDKWGDVATSVGYDD
jgi:NAD(P)-dependent dehydrogenase (short-subunit alcohol dehydrogenase family)